VHPSLCGELIYAYASVSELGHIYPVLAVNGHEHGSDKIARFIAPEAELRVEPEVPVKDQDNAPEGIGYENVFAGRIGNDVGRNAKLACRAPSTAKGPQCPVLGKLVYPCEVGISEEYIPVGIDGEAGHAAVLRLFFFFLLAGLLLVELFHDDRVYVISFLEHAGAVRHDHFHFLCIGKIEGCSLHNNSVRYKISIGSRKALQFDRRYGLSAEVAADDLSTAGLAPIAQDEDVS